MVDETIQCVPPNYNDQSTLKIEITGGKVNIHDFDLKPTPAKR